MNFSKIDTAFMVQAIKLAKHGMFSVTGNPMVGCIITQENEVVGQGFHEEAGSNHAEINAINDAKNKGSCIRGATVYVTLEPCAHFGKTAPCVDALIHEGVREVIIGSLDRNPLVSGKGVAKLIAKGIDVRYGCLESECIDLNKGFFKRIQSGSPYVIVKSAMSIDGRLAMNNGESKWITGELSRRDVHVLRGSSDAIITGIGTIISDNPRLNSRINSEFIKTNVQKINQPFRIVLDAKLEIPITSNVCDTVDKLMIFCVEGWYSNEKYKELTNIGIEVISLKDSYNSRVDLKEVLNFLANRGLNYVMVEAGSKLTTDFISRELIDEMHIYMAPILMGCTAQPLFSIALEHMKEKSKFKFKHVDKIGEDIKIILK
jgi:diaminohydroxyphosphoribosylaminopyrimidine deaminase / 5-amino-6-(5-phosphoribosylamino)uracil reductase